MDLSLSLAKEAYEDGEVPVGCIITDKDGNVIGKGRNRREKTHDATAHAEIEAIKDACRGIEDWRLDECSLYVTLEPCPMCAGAILSSRIGTVVYGAKDENTGSCGSVIDLFSENYGHRPKVFSGVKKEESKALLKSFFEDKRQ